MLEQAVLSSSTPSLTCVSVSEAENLTKADKSRSEIGPKGAEKKKSMSLPHLESDSVLRWKLC